MFHIVIYSFLKTPRELSARMAEHQDFLEAFHRTGSFLLSGLKSTGDGSIAIAQTETRDELIEILEQDPLRKHGMISYEVIGFALNSRTFALTEELFLGSKAVSRLIRPDAFHHEHMASA